MNLKMKILTDKLYQEQKSSHSKQKKHCLKRINVLYYLLPFFKYSKGLTFGSLKGIFAG